LNLDGYRKLAAQSSNCVAWLRVLREGESSQNEDANTLLYGGGHFEGFDDHPRIHFDLPGGNYTTAAGPWQITATTWDDFCSHFGKMAFTPENQGACAVWLTDRAGALDDVLAGRLNAAIQRCAKVWTSLAIAKRQAEAPQVFAAYGGTLEPTVTPQAPEVTVAQPAKAKSMGVLLTLLPTLVQMLPQLGQLFGSGSEVSNRNIAAAKVVADTVVQATQSSNVQDAIEKMTTDSTALQAAKDAVSEILPQLMDVGGGVESARKFAAEHENGRYGRILEVVTYCAMFFLLLANAMSAAAAYLLHDASVLADVKQADIGAALIAFGYFLGSSISSKRKDEMKAAQ
jgi:muramidase (phage lysozyme)